MISNAQFRAAALRTVSVDEVHNCALEQSAKRLLEQGVPDERKAMVDSFLAIEETASEAKVAPSVVELKDGSFAWDGARLRWNGAPLEDWNRRALMLASALVPCLFDGAT